MNILYLTNIIDNWQLGKRTKMIWSLKSEVILCMASSQKESRLAVLTITYECCLKTDCKLFESFQVVICNSSDTIRMSQSNCDETMKNTDVALDSVVKSTKQMIRTLKSICATFHHIPANRSIAMTLTYNEESNNRNLSELQMKLVLWRKINSTSIKWSSSLVMSNIASHSSSLITKHIGLWISKFSSSIIAPKYWNNELSTSQDSSIILNRNFVEVSH